MSETVQSLTKALKILKLFIKKQPLKLSEICEATGYGKTVVFRIMATLMEEGFIKQDKDSRYYIDQMLYLVGKQFKSLYIIENSLKEYLLSLRQRTDCSVQLCIREGNEVLVIASYENSNNLRIVTEVGSKIPIHATASGKALLATLDDDVINYLLNSYKFVQYNDKTVSSIEQLWKEIKKDRERGYSVTNGEYIDYIFSMAKSIEIPYLNEVCAISIMTFGNYVDDELFLKLQNELFRCADEISKEFHTK